MKKILLIPAALILLAAAALAAAGYHFGKGAEAQIRARIDDWTLPGILNVELLEYHRGFFRSEATTRIRLDLPAAYESEGGESISGILIRHEIAHGPLPFAGSFHGAGAPFAAAAVVDSAFSFETPPELYRTLFGDASPLQYRVVIGFDERLDGTVHGPELIYEPADAPIRVAWSGIAGTFRVDGEAIRADVRAPGLTLKGTELGFALREISLKADGRTHPSGLLFLGKREARLENLQMTGHGGETLFAAEKLSAVADQTEDNGVFNALLSYGIERLVADGDKFGPFVCDVTLKRIDIEAMGALSEFFQEFGQPYLSEETRGAILEEKGVPALVGLLARSPEVEVTRLSLATPEGEMRGHLKITGEPAGTVTAGSIHAIERYIEAEAELTMPRELLLNLAAGWMTDSAAFELALTDPDGNFTEEDVRVHARKMADETVRSLTAERILVQKGAELTAKIELADGELRVNGRRLDLPEGDL